MNNETQKQNNAGNSEYVELALNLEPTQPKKTKSTIKERLEKIDAQQTRSKEKARKLIAKQKILDMKKRNEFNGLIVQALRKKNSALLSEISEFLFKHRPDLRLSGG